MKKGDIIYNNSDISSTQLIAHHIDLLQCEEGEEKQCKICGRKTTHYLSDKKILSEKFNDFDRCKQIKSEIVCIECASCIKNATLRRACFYADKDKLCFFKKNEIEDIIFNITKYVKVPFIFCFTKSFKKHNSFKATVNYSTSRFMIQAEDEQFLFDVQKYRLFYYDVLKPAYFELMLSKDELLTGNYTTLVDAKLLAEIDKLLKPYRKTAIYEFLVYILDSDERNKILKERKEKNKNARTSKKVN